jgi:hypothetical protein
MDVAALLTLGQAQEPTLTELEENDRLVIGPQPISLAAGMGSDMLCESGWESAANDPQRLAQLRQTRGPIQVVSCQSNLLLWFPCRDPRPNGVVPAKVFVVDAQTGQLIGYYWAP